MRLALILGVVVTAVLTSPGVGWTQAKTNFSGTWTFDATKSDPAPSPVGRRGGGFGRGGGAGPANSVTINQTESQVTIERSTGQAGQTAAVYKLDGSESTNLMGDVFLSRSTVAWDGPKLIISTTKDMGLGPNGPMSENTKEIYSLDGGVLTIVATTHNVPGTAQTRKLVYNKKS